LFGPFPLFHSGEERFSDRGWSGFSGGFGVCSLGSTISGTKTEIKYLSLSQDFMVSSSPNHMLTKSVEWIRLIY
jgi:hypothetical protein